MPAKTYERISPIIATSTKSSKLDEDPIFELRKTSAELMTEAASTYSSQ